MQNKTGYLIFLSFISTIISYFISSELIFFSSIFAWIACIILFKQIQNKTLLIVLVVLTTIMISISLINGFKIDIVKLISINQYLLVLLIGVGFLRLIALPIDEDENTIPKGKKSFLNTYFSLHLFGSTINISALLIIADKLYKRANLTNLQIILLTRAFSSDAYWSPFFVAFGATVTYIPNLKTLYIIVCGLVLALITFLITYFDVKNDKNLDEFKGYPLKLDTLFLPFLLAIFVLIAHYLYPNIKIIVLIPTFAILLCIFILIKRYDYKIAYEKLKNHIEVELPKMKMEISLFLIAGMFGISISSIFIGLGFTLPFSNYSYIEASQLLLVFILLSFIGIHPIITIAILGNMLHEYNHTLVALTFLMAWSTTVSTSPFSGVNMTLNARYNVNTYQIFRLNIFYTIKIYFFCVIMLYFVSKILGV